MYLLIDPASDTVFYVGKGTGSRFSAHGAEELLLADDATPVEAGQSWPRSARSGQEARSRESNSAAFA